MNETHSWRDALGDLIRNPRERERLADAIGVHPLTLVRWAKGHSAPRQEALHSLLAALSRSRGPLAGLIAGEYPGLSLSQDSDEEYIPSEIPSAFYAHVLSASTISPEASRFWSICTLVVRQLLQHLDPHQKGLGVTIAQCVPPSPGQKVRSLRKTLGQGTAVWQTYFDNRTQFLGAESRVGQVMMTGRLVVVQSAAQQTRMFPGHHPPSAESALTCPLIQAGRVAGCLGVFSTQQDFFSPARRELVEHYARLLLIAFERLAFYAFEEIELRMMPSSVRQQPLLDQFQDRVTQHMLQAAIVHEPLTLLQAEALVWQEIEEELLQLAYDPTPFLQQEVKS